MTQETVFEGWAVVELMGHVRMAGYVTETMFAGAKIGRIEIPPARPDEKPVTLFFGGGSIYRMTPTTEEVARSVAASNRPQPVHAWEMPRPQLGDGGGADTEIEEADLDDDIPV